MLHTYSIHVVSSLEYQANDRMETVWLQQLCRETHMVNYKSKYASSYIFAQNLLRFLFEKCYPVQQPSKCWWILSFHPWGGRIPLWAPSSWDARHNWTTNTKFPLLVNYHCNICNTCNYIQVTHLGILTSMSINRSASGRAPGSPLKPFSCFSCIH